MTLVTLSTAFVVVKCRVNLEPEYRREKAGLYLALEDGMISFQSLMSLFSIGIYVAAYRIFNVYFR
jgi:hypothetical protein